MKWTVQSVAAESSSPLLHLNDTLDQVPFSRVSVLKNVLNETPSLHSLCADTVANFLKFLLPN